MPSVVTMPKMTAAINTAIIPYSTAVALSRSGRCFKDDLQHTMDSKAPCRIPPDTKKVEEIPPKKYCQQDGSWRLIDLVVRGGSWQSSLARVETVMTCSII